MVGFTLTPDDLALYDADLKRIVEPGLFKVFVGSSSGDIRATGEFTVRER
jgi:beta-glucosidase